MRPPLGSGSTTKAGKSRFSLPKPYATQLPELYRTVISLDELQALVARLLPPGPPLISPDDVTQAYEQHGPNVRELLFAMYDLYELRRNLRFGEHKV